MKNKLPELFFLLSLLLGLLAQAHAQDINFSVRVNEYDHERYNVLTNRTSREINNMNTPVTIETPGSQWEVISTSSPASDRKGAVDYAFTFECKEGEVPQGAVSIDLTIADWSVDNYVLMPAAAYNGNRFDYRRIRYSPKLLDPRDIGPDIPTIVSDIPKLDKGNGPSRIQQRTGDMSSPSVGFWFPDQKKAFWMLTTLSTEVGDSGIDIEETRSRDKAVISVTAPVIREVYKYRITDNRYPSNDKPHHYKKGDKVTIKLRLLQFDAPVLQDLFDKFTNIRKDLVISEGHNLVLPFSAAFDVQEDKFNELNWEDKFGYYSVGPRNMFLQDWQIGWTGGMISTFPLLWMGDENTRKNVIRNFDWLFPDGIAPSGLFWDSGEHGDKWYGGDIRKPHTKNWHLIRKSGDGLYYILKQLMLMEKMGMEVKDSWRQGSRGAADALVKIWKENGQLGQFVDNPTGKIEVGGSTSGGIVPAALVLASQYYHQPEYLQAAREIAQHYYDNYVQKGISTGGPGDAMQNNDSESSYALVESFAILYEATHDDKWLQMGEDMARQFSTWVIAYDYPFPDNSLFGKVGMHSKGGVFANTQNKHGAPGICTHSGVALLRLYRATGDKFYAELLQDIVRNMPQYLPHPKHPIEGAKQGWMCERINTTDWLEGIGEISYLTTWSETALMLTYTEIPGIYVEPDQGRVMAFDNVKASIAKETKRKLQVSVHNPTASVAKVKILAENSSQKAKPLGELALFGCDEIELQPNETRIISFNKR